MCKLQLEPLHNIGGLLFARIFAEIKFYIVKILNKWDKLTGDLINKKILQKPSKIEAKSPKIAAKFRATKIKNLHEMREQSSQIWRK